MTPSTGGVEPILRGNHATAYRVALVTTPYYLELVWELLPHLVVAWPGSKSITEYAAELRAANALAEVSILADLAQWDDAKRAATVMRGVAMPHIPPQGFRTWAEALAGMDRATKTTTLAEALS